jgi:hypothetical protein
LPTSSCLTSRPFLTDVIDKLYSGLERITPGDIKDAANYYLIPEKRNVVLVRGEK